MHLFAFLGPFHPQIVHTPIVMLIFSAFFALVGRLFDREWLKKMSVVMLVIGFIGAYLAIQSGRPAHRVPERQQGVPEHDIDEHSDGAQWVLYLSGGALGVMFIASRLQGGAANALGLLALVMQLCAAAAVGVTAWRGGKLVFDHGANVKVDGQLVKSTHAARQQTEPDSAGGEKREREER
jgi:uncharacterized membrane protein